MLRTCRLGTLAALCALAVSAVPGCASDDADGANGNPGAGERAAAAPDRPPPEGTVKSLPPETRARIEEGLRQFARNDPRWPQTRAELLALGEREAQVVVQTLWSALLVMQKRNQPTDVERARHELALIGLPSVPLLAGILSAGQVGTVEDPVTKEEVPIMMDDLQRREASEVLTILGEPAVPAVVESLARAETKSGRLWAIRTLGNMGDRGGSVAATALAAAARDSDDVVRVDAVDGMKYWTEETTRAALLAALGDPEELVRTKAAGSLAHREDAGAVATIRAAAETARDAGRIAEAKRLEQAAVWIERHEKPPDAEREW